MFYNRQMKPIIGITTNQSKNANGQPTIMLMQSYVNAVMQAGGVLAGAGLLSLTRRRRV